MTKQHQPAEPLLTRHVFLDTQVYRELGHNPANPALQALKQNVDADRVVLHITDITLFEVKRQIRELVALRDRELQGIEKDLKRWRHQAPKSMPAAPARLDVAAVSAAVFEHFRSFVVDECRAHVHEALAIDPGPVFARYFDRLPPFDGAGSKEFPDAFVIDVLSRWAETAGEPLHVVTQDGAMNRAAKLDPNLHPLGTIHEVLARAIAFLDADVQGMVEAEAEALLNGQSFDGSLELLLDAQMKEATFTYVGDLPEGEAYEGEFVSIEEIGNWSTVGLTDHRLSLLLDVRAAVSVEVQYEDRDNASYDREDDVWFGAEDASTVIEEAVDFEVFVEVDRFSGGVVGGRILTNEIRISGPHDNHHRY